MQTRQQKLLGHVIRCGTKDHSRRVATDAEFKQVERSKRRVRRPKCLGLQNVMTRAFKFVRRVHGMPKCEFDMHNWLHRETVARAALGKGYPFDKKRKRPNLRKRRNKDKEKEQRSIIIRDRDHTRASKRRSAGETNRILKNRRAGKKHG